MKPKKTIYYTDELNDDFAGNNINTKRVEADFKFRRTGFWWRIIEFFAYYIIALPIVFVIAKIYLGLKFENRRVVKTLKKTGFFLYGNHTRNLDAFVPCLAAFPKKTMVVCNPDAVSIPGIKLLVQMLGGLPLPSELSGMMNFMRAVEDYSRDGRCVAIYPEAHVWPFYTGIRPFRPESFMYPLKSSLPAVAMVTTYRRRGGLFRLCRRPGMTVTLSRPFYPDNSLPLTEACVALRNKAYEFMANTSKSHENVEYIHYEKKQ